MDLPLFGASDHPSKRRREINLGGTSSASTSSSILQDARTRRTARLDAKRRQDSASTIQLWWRGRMQIQAVKHQLRATFEEDVTGLTGLRCLVLIGQDEISLGKWSTQTTAMGRDQLLVKLTDENWVTLLRPLSVLLLSSISAEAQSQTALAHATVLDTLLCYNAGSLSQPVISSRRSLQAYLLHRGYYSLLKRTFSQIPEKSTSSILAILVGLLTSPYSIFDAGEPEYKTAVEDLLAYALTVPILAKRLPISLLGRLAPLLPLQNLHLADRDRVLSNMPTLESKVHLLANLCAFTPARYPFLSAPALNAFLQLSVALMSSIPVHGLEPYISSRGTATDSTGWAEDDSDSESVPHVVVVDSFDPPPVRPKVDDKTLSRLQTLFSPKHVNSLLTACYKYRETQPNLFAWCVTLCHIWPTNKDKVLGAVVVFGRGGLVRELYRGFVRGTQLGQNITPSALMDSAHATQWPPLLLLVDLYTQALLTMGDDEFFSTGAGSSGAHRNPLTLDELTSFSRQLLNIAFTLYSRDDQTSFIQGKVPGMMNLRWEAVREKVTKCLQAIHTRDSRRPFTPPDHWLVNSSLSMNQFIEAAVIEERQLAQPDGGRPLSKRQIAAISPRLGVLNHIPFAIPFDVRVSIFRQFVLNDMKMNGLDRFSRMGRAEVVVRRGMIAQDGFDKLQDVNLKAPIAIRFIDQFGQEEAGIDGGGVFKEFLTSLCKEVFDTDHGLWLATKQHELYPNPHAYATESHSLSWYRFIGRILGKALYEGILVDVAFAGFFLAKWLGKQSYLDDLSSLDPELYQGLLFLKHYDGNPEDLSLNFTVTKDEFGVTQAVPLVPGGNDIAVTRENRLQYIYLISHYRLNRQIKLQCDAFFEGLSEMIDPKWLRMFNQQELQILLGGVDSPVDLDDLRQHTNYGGLYDDHEPTIEAFWRVLNSFNHDERRKLLRFATSCSRPPLLGFKELVPNFAIRDAGSDELRLPTASTCVNLLKLPRYKSDRILREKLLQAIHSNAGFDLS